MGFVAAAGIAAAGAIGSSVMGARAASKQADAQVANAVRTKKQEEAFRAKWDANLSTLIQEKENKLYDLGNIFERFQSTGAFGSTTTEENLRRAQEDFAALAAGDFTAFEGQLRKNLSDNLINTIGSGAPVGAFAQLGVETQMNMRREGLQTATGLSEFFANQAQNLLGLEFGIMDQSFDTGYKIDRGGQDSVNAANQQIANQAGAGDMATASMIGNISNTIGGFGSFLGAMNLQQQGIEMRQREINSLRGSMVNAPQAGFSFDRFTSGSFSPLISLPSSGGGYSSKSSISSAPVPMYPMGQSPWDSPGVLPSIDGISGPRNSSLSALIETGMNVMRAM